MQDIDRSNQQGAGGGERLHAVLRVLTYAACKVPEEVSDYMQYCAALAQIDKRQWALEDDVADSYRCVCMLYI